MVEIANQLACKGRRSYCAVGDEVFVLGSDEVQMIQNSMYVNIKPEDIAAQVKSEVHRLPANAQVRYLPPLFQVWYIGRDVYIVVYSFVLDTLEGIDGANKYGDKPSDDKS